MVSDDRSSTDPYLDLLKSDNHMLSRRSQYNGRNDSLSVREEVSGEDTESGETTDTESEESEEEDWQTGPPVDYLENVQVRRYLQWILTAEGEVMDYHFYYDSPGNGNFNFLSFVIPSNEYGPPPPIL